MVKNFYVLQGGTVLGMMSIILYILVIGSGLPILVWLMMSLFDKYIDKKVIRAYTKQRLAYSFLIIMIALAIQGIIIYELWDFIESLNIPESRCLVIIFNHDIYS